MSSTLPTTRQKRDRGGEEGASAPKLQGTRYTISPHAAQLLMTSIDANIVLSAQAHEAIAKYCEEFFAQALEKSAKAALDRRRQCNNEDEVPSGQKLEPE